MVAPTTTPPRDTTIEPKGLGAGVAPAKEPAASMSSLGYATPAVLLVGLLMVASLVVLVVYSFWPTSSTGQVEHRFTFSNYVALFASDTYVSALVRTLVFVTLAAALTALFTFPMAYFIGVRVPPNRRMVWILLAIMPFWTSYLIRVFAWMNIFGDGGVANSLLTKVGLLHEPSTFFGFGMPAIVITLVYLQFPLTFLTTYIAIERIDPSLRDGAADLGTNSVRTLIHVTLPLCRTGLFAGFALAFMAMIGDYVTPKLIGGTEGTFYANLIVNQFGASQQWGFGAALTFLMLISVTLLLLAVRRSLGGVTAAGEYTRKFEPRRAPWLRVYSLAVLLFLYAPISMVFLLAVNSSPTVGLPITGFTFEWFVEAFRDDLILTALFTSLKIAGSAVLISTVIGVAAAIPLSRRVGTLRNAAATLLGLPLLLPPVVMGIGLIIALNAMSVERGLWLIVLGHVLLIVPLVVFMTMARLEGLPANQEAAAMDLGATPRRALMYVTLPQAFPAIVASAMIGLALSMDEFILTFLVTGSTTTLPLYIYGSLRFGVSPSIVALSAVLLGLSLLALGLAGLSMTGFQVFRRRGADSEASQPVGSALGAS